MYIILYNMYIIYAYEIFYMHMYTNNHLYTYVHRSLKEISKILKKIKEKN